MLYIESFLFIGNRSAKLYGQIYLIGVLIGMRKAIQTKRELLSIDEKLLY